MVVDTTEKLARFLPTLRQASWVAVDTEADSLHAYPEKLCLIQISTAAGDRLVDPLAGFPLNELLAALAGHQLIMHGADYDLRLLSKHHEFIPSTIFDTMLAARLLGQTKFGLGDLVERHLGVKLEKGPQKANWALRPLSERMEKYARNDTHYLRALSEHLASELRSLGRLSWHQEWCARLIVESSKPVEIDKNTVWRMKGANKLGRPALAVLKSIYYWREKEATVSDRPPFFILSHHVAIEVAATAAAGKNYERCIPVHLTERRRQGLLKAVEQGLLVSPDQYPRLLMNHGRHTTDAERRRYLELQARRDHQAARLKIDPTLIASRSVLSDLAHNWDKHVPDLMRWQLELLSESPS